MTATLTVTQRRSSNGCNRRQLDTLRSLGLRRIGHTIEIADNAQARGMVHAVRHIVEVTEPPASSSSPKRTSAGAAKAAGKPAAKASGKATTKTGATATDKAGAETAEKPAPKAKAKPAPKKKAPTKTPDADGAPA